MGTGLGVLFGVNFSTALPPERLVILLSLWSTLFLVTPVVSTTSASVGRMLEQMPPESMGWLLIDEAGQAVPQAAIGALMRAKSAFVIGDPPRCKLRLVTPTSLTIPSSPPPIVSRAGLLKARGNSPLTKSALSDSLTF